LTRIRYAHRRVERAERELADRRAEFRDEIRQALAEGETMASIAKLLNVTRQRIATLAKPERK
jgi:hypothetical protein